MLNPLQLEQKISQIRNENDFNTTAIEVFYFQYENNNIYHQWVDNLGIKPGEIKSAEEIPFLPISLFKSHEIKSFNGKSEIIFKSSGTTGKLTSRHFVKSIDLYRESYTRSFNFFYGDMAQYTFLALLPSYLEREGSSLILMAEDLIKSSNDARSGFYLYNYSDLYDILTQLKSEEKKVILVGVSFALLEFTEKYNLDFNNLIVMETGGMKGKRKELLRPELHSILQTGFGVKKIHSEYGMTELMSQAYSNGNGIFHYPPWMKILIRDTNDPLSLIENGKAGGINVIDLFNLYSCSFIATQDLGILGLENSFEIIGRFDNSDIRGCNLLVQ
jgi:hypothetical protein